MKKILFILALCICYTTTFSQDGRSKRSFDPEKRAEMQATEMKESLSLSEAQAHKVKGVFLTFNTEMKKIRDEGRNGNRELLREKLTVLRHAQEVQLKKYLTDDQFSQWKRKRAEQRKTFIDDRNERKKRKNKKENKSPDEHNPK